jgi:hypothetical protein
MAGGLKVICAEPEAEYFLQRDWTGRNSLNGLEKFDFARIRHSGMRHLAQARNP